MKFFSKNKSAQQPRRRQMSLDDRTDRRARVDELQEQQYMFRRNRTLSGSSSSAVNSATTTGEIERSPRAQAHQLARARRKLSTALLIVFGALIILAGLIYQLTATVVISTSSGTALTSEQTKRYSDALQTYYELHPLERLRFLLNESQLTAFLAAATPEVASITQQGNAGIGKSNYTLSFRQPTTGWIINNAQYYVDASGVPFSLNYYATPAVQIVDESGIPQQAGVAIASNRFLSFVGRIVGSLNDIGLPVERVTIPAQTTHQIAVVIKGKPYYIKVSVDRSVGEQVEDISHVVQYFDQKGVAPEYADVRVQGRAYYRTK